jgi:ATP-dependent DNA ligase
MLCEERLMNISRLVDQSYIAEPKLDGQRAQLSTSIKARQSPATAAVALIPEHVGMAWLRDIEWPFESAIFDGEACAGDGHEGIQAVLTERNRAGGDMALTPLDQYAWNQLLCRLR